MLSCQDCEKYLAAFLDKALEVKASLDVQEHLLHCSPCADRAEGERTLHAFVSEHARVPPLPDEVKCRIVRQAMPAPAPQSWWAHVRAVIHPCGLGHMTVHTCGKNFSHTLLARK